MTTFTALTTLAGRAPAEALAEAIEHVAPEPTGVGLTAIQDGSGLWEVGGYFQGAPDETALAVLAAAFDAKPFVITQLPETDWVAKVRRDLAPVEAGRFFVYGSHDADKKPTDPDRIALLIEAALAFGTGHHGTTLGCLRALDRLVDQGFAPKSIADIGCGTAVLAMAASAVWPVVSLASDIDAVAVDVAQSNVDANDMTGRVRCIQAAGLDHPDLAAAQPFDLIFANILKGPLIAMAPDVSAAAAPGCKVILSGILNEQADEVLGVYFANGFNLDLRQEIVEWTTLTLTKKIQ